MLLMLSGDGLRKLLDKVSLATNVTSYRENPKEVKMVRQKHRDSKANPVGTGKDLKKAHRDVGK